MLIVRRVMIHQKTEKTEFRKSGTKKWAAETPKNTAE